MIRFIISDITMKNPKFWDYDINTLEKDCSVCINMRGDFIMKKGDAFNRILCPISK